MKLKFLFLTVAIFALAACSNDDDNGGAACDMTTLISPEQFVNAPSAALGINTLEITGDCLKINFSSSGCDGNTWQLKLIDSGGVSETTIPQRDLRLSLKNEEECLAVITKEMTFDISNLKVQGGQVQLNITNTEDGILYQY